jgi:hypothetical protein
MDEEDAGRRMLNNGLDKLSDDDLFDRITKIRSMLGQKVAHEYPSMGDSIHLILADLEEEMQMRQFKEMNKINNDPINLGVVIDDKSEL